jgi:dipeptidase
MKRFLAMIAIALSTFLLQIQPMTACTNYLITKGASADGSTMISYAADSHSLFGELYHWPARRYKPGTMLKIYEWDTGKLLGEIPQVRQTYTVTGNMNEYQVAIGETTFGGREELGSQAGAIMDYGALMWVTLQRAKTAREAIRIITELMDAFGYYSSGESFSISDPNEVWIMEMISKGDEEKGAVWVALKIPDGYVSGHANQARITTFDFQLANRWDDPEATVFNAPDVITFARKMAWYDGPDHEFSFSDTYAPVDFGGARFCEIRVYSMFHKVNQEFKNNRGYWEYCKGHIRHGKHGYAVNRMPLWVKPDRKITVHDMMMFMRDHLEGTELDMSLDIGAGPWQNPYRWRPLTWVVDGVRYCNERATATQQTAFSFVSQSRSWLPREIGGILWFGVGDASSCVYVPMYAAMTRPPETFATGNGDIMEWSENAAFWVFNQISNFAYTRYNLIHPEIAKKQLEEETALIAMVAENDKNWQSLNPKRMVKEVTNFSVAQADRITFDWQRFYRYLFMKYMDGNIKTAIEIPDGHLFIPPDVKFPGYPAEFLRMIINQTGDQFKVITAPAE